MREVTTSVMMEVGPGTVSVGPGTVCVGPGTVVSMVTWKHQQAILAHGESILTGDVVVYTLVTG